MSTDPADPDREVLVTLALPLDLRVAAAIGNAVADAVEGLGYTDVRVTTGMEKITAARPRRKRDQRERDRAEQRATGSRGDAGAGGTVGAG